MRKHCPYCAHDLNFIEFVTGYGSDTLFKHSARAHPHEHPCLSCHRVVWVHYDRAFFEQRFRQSFLLHLIFSAVLTFFGIKPALHFSDIQAVLFMGMALLFGGVIIMAYSRYESASLKQEKSLV